MRVREVPGADSKYRERPPPLTTISPTRQLRPVSTTTPPSPPFCALGILSHRIVTALARRESHPRRFCQRPTLLGGNSKRFVASCGHG